MKHTTEKKGRPVSVRVRLTSSQAMEFERMREFLGMPSLSGTVARLALWNLSSLSEALSVNTTPEKVVATMGPMIADVTQAAIRSAVRDGIAKRGGV